MQIAHASNIAPDPSLSDREILSAWMDGEDLPDGQVQTALVHRNREIWDTYHLIGDVLRSQDLAVEPSKRFQDGWQRAMQDQMPIVAPARRHPTWRIGLSGLAVAAALASVVWVSVPFLRDEGVSVSDGQVVADAAGPQQIEDNGLRDYLEAHRQIAGPSAVRQVSFDNGSGR